MDEATRARLREFAEAADDLHGKVEEALAPDAPHSFMVETRAKVDAIGAELMTMLAGLGPSARTAVERTVGRKVTDLQRLAAPLPVVAVGKPAKIAPNNGFIETRPPPPRPPEAARAPARRAPPRKPASPKRVGGTLRASTSALTAAQLAESLHDAAVVKPYSMEQRYEPGDVIDHATFGRGRVERLQPRSMQVQFAIGVKSLRTG